MLRKCALSPRQSMNAARGQDLRFPLGASCRDRVNLLQTDQYCCVLQINEAGGLCEAYKSKDVSFIQISRRRAAQ